MLRVALKGLAGRPVRALLTAIAIILGVAMISGTYVLTDTINNGFNTIFAQSYKNADVVITGKAAFDNANGNTVEPPPMPESLLTEVQKLPDVALAAGSVTTSSLKLIGKDGKVITTGGAPSLGFSVTPAGQPFNPTKLTAGSWPKGNDQVVIDKATASGKGFQVGDRIGVQAFGPARQLVISGIAEFPGVSVGGATFAILDQPTAQVLFDKVGELDAIRVQSKAGASEADLVAQIKPLLSSTEQVRSGTEQAKKDQENAGSFISFLRYALLAFAGISLFVGAFVIANTLSITIAQRMREFATLRTLGASRRQVLWSVVIEAFVIGLVGSVIGLFLGLGLAKLLNALFVAVGIDLPHGSTVFATRTVIVSLLVGTLVTLFASIRPARRATRVPPIAAVREGSVLPPSRWAKYGTITSLSVLVLAVVMVSLGALASGIATGPRLLLLGIGVLLLFFGVSMNAAKVVRPLAAVLGAPARTIGGAPGILARDNATRNPARTASTASALMIGLALVTFVAIFGQGLRSSFEGAVNELFIGDYALTSTNTFTPIEAAAGQALVGKPGIHDVSAIRAGSARYLGSNNDLTAVQPNLNKTLFMKWTQGSDAVPGELGNDGFFASKNYVKDHHLSLGSPVTLQFPSGKKTTVKLKGVWDEPKGGSPFAHITISTTLFDKFTPRPQDEMVLANTPGGVTDANTANLENAVKGFADAKVQTRNEFKSNFEAPINKLLNLLYALLALAVIVSLVGIINTLVLTVFERTREIGMLRAVGMTRRQVRMMIRYESIVTALMGAALGLVVGIFLAALVTHALSSSGIVFAVPWIELVYFVL
ncbi:MAG TPA: FtsX-like permease family protein, partial [Gaiellaceae bacterium]|nr:FtsX-like permease family protein [Gaiellaceae bacterium]